MQCPVCTGTALVMSERNGIEIDYCPHCRGVWLDRGELDKIVDRAGPVQAAALPAAQHYSDRRASPPVQGQHYRKKKREGFLGELFDFD
ncbi:MAG: hypothetical protein EOO28_16100 [Comamonadaceae bacterium]|nr:MAG: hypothetical protein EOO28_16100 [Comamonadaceae bacterium]